MPRIKQAIKKKALPSADVELEIDPNHPGVLASYLVETYLNTGCRKPTWEVAPSEADADENESEEVTDNTLILTGVKRKKKCGN